MATPHIEAAPGDFAPTVLMPGDPRRAQHIAEHYLDGAVQVNSVRAMAGYTGYFRGERVSVMASGMGIPSAAIYITELIRHYGVSRLIRVGTAGVYQPELALRQLVVADRCVTNSNLPTILGAPEELVPSPSLLAAAHDAAAASGQSLLAGTVFTSDIFYEPDDEARHAHTADGVLCVEMETAALYAIAAIEGAQALTVLTMTDHLVSGEHLSSQDRQSTVGEMIELGLAVAVS